MGRGKIVQIVGPIVDVRFSEEKDVPAVLSALKIRDKEKNIDLTLEIVQITGNNTVRCVALSSTDGLTRGMEVEDLGRPITVPVGRQTLGRIFNVLGATIDDKGLLAEPQRRNPIHRPSPDLSQQLPVSSVLVTGLKVIDLLAPFPRGGKIGLF